VARRLECGCELGFRVAACLVRVYLLGAGGGRSLRRPSQLCDAATVIGDLDAAGRVCELLGAGRDRLVVMTKDTQANDGTGASVLSKSLCRAAMRGPRRMIGRG